MNDAQIKHMVDRFLGWRLPETFNPDCGVSFKRLENRHHHPEASPFFPMPTGTNLFDAEQATAMVRYMVEGLPASAASELSTRIQARVQGIPVSGNGSLQPGGSTLRHIMSRSILERICDAAAEVALSQKE